MPENLNILRAVLQWESYAESVAVASEEKAVFSNILE